MKCSLKTYLLTEGGSISPETERKSYDSSEIRRLNALRVNARKISSFREKFTLIHEFGDQLDRKYSRSVGKDVCHCNNIKFSPPDVIK
jgi:hypothetical protein